MVEVVNETLVVPPPVQGQGLQQGGQPGQQGGGLLGSQLGSGTQAAAKTIGLTRSVHSVSAASNATP